MGRGSGRCSSVEPLFLCQPLALQELSTPKRHPLHTISPLLPTVTCGTGRGTRHAQVLCFDEGPATMEAKQNPGDLRRIGALDDQAPRTFRSYDRESGCF